MLKTTKNEVLKLEVRLLVQNLVQATFSVLFLVPKGLNVRLLPYVEYEYSHSGGKIRDKVLFQGLSYKLLHIVIFVIACVFLLWNLSKML